jgi:hypothetical protein
LDSNKKNENDILPNKYDLEADLAHINFTMYLKQHLTETNARMTKFIKTKFGIDEEKMNNSRFTCGLQSFLKRGPRQKVVAYSLYGDDERYYKKLLSIAKQINNFLPGWVMRIYHDNSMNKSYASHFLCSKDIHHVDFCDVTQLHMSKNDFLYNKTFNGAYLHGMKWRWLPIGDDFVDVFSSRDTDSFMLEREVDAVQSWLKSGLYAHIMRG